MLRCLLPVLLDLEGDDSPPGIVIPFIDEDEATFRRLPEDLLVFGSVAGCARLVRFAQGCHVGIDEDGRPGALTVTVEGLPRALPPLRDLLRDRRGTRKGAGEGR